MVVSAWDLVFRFWDKELFLTGILFRYWIKGYFCLGSCLGTVIKGYFCLGIELKSMVLRPFSEGNLIRFWLSCIQAIKKCWGKLCRLKTIETFF